MNRMIPHTPFSTNLSGSAKETELRIRNIMSGPKKRPPLLFLALVFSLCLLCGNLVSCQVAEAETADVSSSQPGEPEKFSRTEAQPLPEGWLAGEVKNIITAEYITDETMENLTPEEAAFLNNLPAGDLPREAVEVFEAVRRDCWHDTLLPVAYDEAADVTVYFVVNPDSMPNVEPLVGISPMLWGGLERRGIVLRCGDRTGYFPLNWDINAKFASNPTLLADDLDGDGQPEAALSLAWGEGTGCYCESLYIFDLDTMTYTIPDYSGLPLEVAYNEEKTAARLTSGAMELEADLTQLYEPFQGTVEVGNQVSFFLRDGQMYCCLTLDFSGRMLEYLDSVDFPVLYENGAYRLGEAVPMTDDRME